MKSIKIFDNIFAPSRKISGLKGKKRRGYIFVSNIFEKRKNKGRKIPIVDLNNPNIEHSVKYLECKSIFLTRNEKLAYHIV